MYLWGTTPVTSLCTVLNTFFPKMCCHLITIALHLISYAHVSVPTVCGFAAAKNTNSPSVVPGADDRGAEGGLAPCPIVCLCLSLTGELAPAPPQTNWSQCRLAHCPWWHPSEPAAGRIQLGLMDSFCWGAFSEGTPCPVPVWLLLGTHNGEWRAQFLISHPRSQPTIHRNKHPQESL